MTLTHNQATGVRTRINAFHQQAWDEHNTRYSKVKHSFDLPAIAWRQILDTLIKQCYGPAGGKLKAAKRPADSTYRAIQLIADAVRRMESHPALRGAAVEGSVGDLIPAWRDVVALTNRESSVCSPYPQGPRSQFVLLLPHHVENLGMKVTVWRPFENLLREASSWTYLLDSHLGFVDRSADPERLANRQDLPPLVVG